MSTSGKRAPTGEICNSDEEYVPLAERQHALGPYPMDPNLLSQRVPPDDRVGIEQRTLGPVDGTPLPAGRRPRGHRRATSAGGGQPAANGARCVYRADDAKCV